MWTFVLTTADYKLRVYLDDSLYYTAQYVDWGSITSGNTLYLGSISTTQYIYDGYMDEIRIYNKPLTPVQVTMLYNLGKPTHQ